MKKLQKRLPLVAIALALALIVGAAPARADGGARAVRCTDLLDGASRVDVFTYPAFVARDITVFNDGAELVTVTALQTFPFETEPTALSIDIPPGSSIGGNLQLTIDSFEQCAALAGEEVELEDGVREPVALRAFTRVFSTAGKTRCFATLVCH